ncbi:MAG: paraslipin [Spirochaetales bacterium]|nr:paraslipin [Spirochaetales bacterium]
MMNPSIFYTILAAAAAIIAIITFFKCIRIVPAKQAWVVERLGKYSSTLEAGFHVLIPFIDKVRYKHSLKEKALDVPVQPCFTEDNVRIFVDGVLYLKVVDPVKASYGITKALRTPGLKDYEYATVQLAQTMMRSVIGKMQLDTTFEERDAINSAIVQSVDEASDPWGIKVSRYEIQNIQVPDTILATMEKQMQAERERRARILESEGSMTSRINRSQGEMERMINESEGVKEKLINEAEGKAAEILAVSRATAASISKVADAISLGGGEEAASLQVIEDFIDQMKNLAKKESKVILPMDLSDLSMVEDKIRATLK